MTPTALPPPHDVDLPIGSLVHELAGHLGEPAVVDLCVALLEGAGREEYLAELPYLTGLSFEPGSPVLDPESWKEYWLQVWGARGLLYVWEDRAAAPVVAGVGADHWRPAEMCLKVATKRELGAAGPGAVALLGHELPRVQAQALRALGAAGDTEHVEAVRSLVAAPHPDVRRQAARALERMTERLDLVEQ